VNDKFNDEADPDKDEDFIGFAQQHDQRPAMPSIHEAAIEMQGVEPMLDVQESCDHVLSSVRNSGRIWRFR